MNYDDFAKYIKLIQVHNKKLIKLNEGLGELLECESWIMASFGSDLKIAIRELLAMNFNNQKQVEDLIDYFLYEQPNACITDIEDNRKEYKLNTIQQLYDYLIKFY